MASHGVKFFALLIIVSITLAVNNVFITRKLSIESESQVFTTKSVPEPRQNRESKSFHTALSSDSYVYNTWQARVMYYWFKKNRGPDMGGFTRILHSGRPDSYMDEIPTFIAQPLPPEVHEGYPVLNRPWAIQQWLEKADIKEEYIWMTEPDHLIVKPLPNLATKKLGAAFPFFYMNPSMYAEILAKHFTGGKIPDTKMYPIGGSPVIMSKNDVKKIIPTWLNVSISMKKDKVTDKAFTWLLDMYAYSVASAELGFNYILRDDFMIHPPVDKEVGDKFIIHYAFRCSYDSQGNEIIGKKGDWYFDKRIYSKAAPPRNLTMPPRGVPESMVRVIEMINEATFNIPNWGSEGMEQFSAPIAHWSNLAVVQ